MSIGPARREASAGGGPVATVWSRVDPGDAILISETFTSIQGEGALAGVPSWFCRFSGCNLRCVWCDTPYASWRPEGKKRSVDDLVAEAVAAGPRHAVITGGEPMLFGAVVPLCDRLRAAGMHVTIETAGTIDRDVPFDLMSISPKLSNSTPRGDPRDPGGAWADRHEARRIDPAVLQSLLDRAGPGSGRTRQIKFVVASPDDLGEIDDLLARLEGWRPEEIFLMPEGVVAPPADRRRFIVEACLGRGWRYGHRLHIELFGDTRGT